MTVVAFLVPDAINSGCACIIQRLPTAECSAKHQKVAQHDKLVRIFNCVH